MRTFIMLYIFTERHSEHRDLIIKIVQPHTNDFVSFVNQGADVAIFPKILPSKQLHQHLCEAVGRMIQICR